MKTRILFVDDEPNVLSGLRRLLRGQRKIWEMDFANGGQDALEKLAESKFDVIVSDMRMPNIDGAELLTRAAALYPDTVRLILSGQSEHEKIFRAIGPAHQFLSKPCDPEVLIRTIERTCALNQRMHNESLRKIVSKIDSLPSLPTVYEELVRELQTDDPSVERVGDLICSDVAMTAKILQLVNSSFFGLPHHVSDARHAASMLGLNVIQPLVLTAKVFCQFEVQEIPSFDLETSITHGMAVATTAREIAKLETESQELVDNTFLAGMLHDLGKIILASRMSEAYGEVMTCSRDTERPLWETELEVLGTTHGDVGAMLLGLWGLPTTIVEAVAFHHFPGESHDEEFSALAAVHAADVLCHQKYPSDNSGESLSLDMEYLARIGLDSKIDQWTAIANEETVA